MDFLFSGTHCIPGVPKQSGTLNFRYFDIRKYILFSADKTLFVE